MENSELDKLTQIIDKQGYKLIQHKVAHLDADRKVIVFRGNKTKVAMAYEMIDRFNTTGRIKVEYVLFVEYKFGVPEMGLIVESDYLKNVPFIEDFKFMFKTSTNGDDINANANAIFQILTNKSSEDDLKVLHNVNSVSFVTQFLKSGYNLSLKQVTLTGKISSLLNVYDKIKTRQMSTCDNALDNANTRISSTSLYVACYVPSDSIKFFLEISWTKEIDEELLPEDLIKKFSLEYHYKFDLDNNSVVFKIFD